MICNLILFKHFYAKPRYIGEKKTESNNNPLSSLALFWNSFSTCSQFHKFDTGKAMFSLPSRLTINVHCPLLSTDSHSVGNVVCQRDLFHRLSVSQRMRHDTLMEMFASIISRFFLGCGRAHARNSLCAII